MLPDTCPTCHAVTRIDSRYVPTLDVRVRVYDCGCALGAGTNAVYTTIACPRTADVLAQLRADNVRLGDRNVLMAMELQAIADNAEEAMDDWLPISGKWVDTGRRSYRALTTIYDLAIEALADGPAAPAADKPANETCPGQSEGVSAAEHVGERSLDTR